MLEGMIARRRKTYPTEWKSTNTGLDYDASISQTSVEEAGNGRKAGIPRSSLKLTGSWWLEVSGVTII